MPNSRFILVPSLELDEIAAYHKDVDSALRLYFSRVVSSKASQSGEVSGDEVRDLLTSRLEESDRRSRLIVLTSLEAVFKLDFKARCDQRLKDPLSRHFRELKKAKARTEANKMLRTRFSLDRDILKGWERYGPSVPSALISELRRAFRLRHWLAHGRHWPLKLDNKYDFAYLHFMATAVFEGFPFLI
jgi:hypothetical protein